MAMMLLAAVLWGFSGFFSRSIMDAGFSPYEVTAVRSVLSVLIMLLILLALDRGSLRIKRRDVLFFVFFGAMKLLTDLTLFISQGSVKLSMSTTLQMMSPVYVVLIAVILYGAKPSSRRVTGVLLSVLGAVLVTGVLFDSDDNDSIGIMAGVLSGLSYGIYTLGAKMAIIRGYTPNGTLFWMFVVPACVSVLIASPVPVFEAGLSDMNLLWAMFGLAILVTLLPYWLQARSMKNLSADTVNIIGVTEAVVAALVGFAIYGETLTVFNVIGMVLVFVAIFVMGREKGEMKLSRNR